MSIPHTGEIKRRPTHPGEMLREDFLPDFGLTVASLAEVIGVSRQSVNALLRERRGVSPEMALRLGRLFGNSPAFWLNAQRAVDLWDVAQIMLGRDWTKYVRCSESCGNRGYVDGRSRTLNYFPMQKVEKISPSRSSVVTLPVMSPSASCAILSSSATISIPRRAANAPPAASRAECAPANASR